MLYENGDLLDLVDMPSMPEANGRGPRPMPLLGWDPRAHARAHSLLRIRRGASDRREGCRSPPSGRLANAWAALAQEMEDAQ